jgi:hypothetical protein
MIVSDPSTQITIPNAGCCCGPNLGAGYCKLGSFFAPDEDWRTITGAQFLAANTAEDFPPYAQGWGYDVSFIEDTVSTENGLSFTYEGWGGKLIDMNPLQDPGNSPSRFEFCFEGIYPGTTHRQWFRTSPYNTYSPPGTTMGCLRPSIYLPDGTVRPPLIGGRFYGIQFFLDYGYYPPFRYYTSGGFGGEPSGMEILNYNLQPLLLDIRFPTFARYNNTTTENCPGQLRMLITGTL